MPTQQQVNDLVEYLLQNGYQAPTRYPMRESNGSAYFYPRYASAETDDSQIPEIICDTGADQQKLARFLFRCSIPVDGNITVYAQIHPHEIPIHMREFFASDLGGVSIPIRNILYPELAGRHNIKYGVSGHGNKWNLKRSNVDGSVSGEVRAWQPDGWVDHRIGRLKRGCAPSMNPISLDVGSISLSRPDVKIDVRIAVNKSIKDTDTAVSMSRQSVATLKKTINPAFYGMSKSNNRKSIVLKFTLKGIDIRLGTFKADEQGIMSMFNARDNYCRENNLKIRPHPTMTQIHLWLERN